ncbi:ANK1 [Symbiodinium pilosum]|uniref:ANK1 protein n=1 Tax=Symbiodinium pilosum TaxID=2952 RepID=A0A812SUR3_SYMPI|nr:ANK1 [Symbiodinium pilosum]
MLLAAAHPDLQEDRRFMLDCVRKTRCWWLPHFAENGELVKDKDFMAQCRAEVGTGLVFTYYQNFACAEDMRTKFPTAGASVPGGQAYDRVMTKLRDPTRHGTATVWFGDEPVFGHSAADGTWVHPSTDCGRDEVPVPPAESRDVKWKSSVDSRSSSLEPATGAKYRCWCCHWLREVRRHHELGEVICCAVSNIYDEDWVEDYGAGSSELSDKDAEKHGLPKETFRNGRPEGWGEGRICISDDLTDIGSAFDRAAAVHPRTQLPLGVGCRWERQALDGMEFPVYAFFMPCGEGPDNSRGQLLAFCAVVYGNKVKDAGILLFYSSVSVELQAAGKMSTLPSQVPSHPQTAGAEAADDAAGGDLLRAAAQAGHVAIKGDVSPDGEAPGENGAGTTGLLSEVEMSGEMFAEAQCQNASAPSEMGSLDLMAGGDEALSTPAAAGRTSEGSGWLRLKKCADDRDPVVEMGRQPLEPRVPQPSEVHEAMDSIHRGRDGPAPSEMGGPHPPAGANKAAIHWSPEISILPRMRTELFGSTSYSFDSQSGSLGPKELDGSENGAPQQSASRHEVLEATDSIHRGPEGLAPSERGGPRPPVGENEEFCDAAKLWEDGCEAQLTPAAAGRVSEGCGSHLLEPRDLQPGENEAPVLRKKLDSKAWLRVSEDGPEASAPAEIKGPEPPACGEEQAGIASGLPILSGAQPAAQEAEYFSALVEIPVAKLFDGKLGLSLNHRLEAQKFQVVNGEMVLPLAVACTSFFLLSSCDRPRTLDGVRGIGFVFSSQPSACKEVSGQELMTVYAAAKQQLPIHFTVSAPLKFRKKRTAPKVLCFTLLSIVLVATVDKFAKARPAPPYCAPEKALLTSQERRRPLGAEELAQSDFNEALRWHPELLCAAHTDLQQDRCFLRDCVKATKCWWLPHFAKNGELAKDEAFMAECKASAGTGLVFTYYRSYCCFDKMRAWFPTAGASVPGGQAYDKVMEKLGMLSALQKLQGMLGVVSGARTVANASSGTATVWFDDEPVFGHSAADGGWVHPSTDCGRDEVPVPPAESRDMKWQSRVDSRSASLVGGSEGLADGVVSSKHCLPAVLRVSAAAQAGAATGSGRYAGTMSLAKSSADWVEKYGAGSSELSDKDAEKHGLPKETFRNGRPESWGEGRIRTSGGPEFDRAAPVHPRTQLPLGVGCRWERQALDGMEFPVYAFFMP